MVAAAIARVLKTLSDSLEVEFATDGDDALSRYLNDSYDLVITDTDTMACLEQP